VPFGDLYNSHAWLLESGNPQTTLVSLQRKWSSRYFGFVVCAYSFMDDVSSLDLFVEDTQKMVIALALRHRRH